MSRPTAASSAGQYDQMIKYATAIRTGTASAEAILRRFARANAIHLVYQAMIEAGRAQRTIIAAFMWNLEPRHVVLHFPLAAARRPGGIDECERSSAPAAKGYPPLVGSRAGGGTRGWRCANAATYGR
jgi:Tn3 transposase DDE domain